MKKPVDSIKIIKTFKALGDPVRWEIVTLLKSGPLCVCKILSIFKMSQPRISRHLKILKNAELVACIKKGKWCYYHLIDSASWKHIKQFLTFPIKNPKINNTSC